MKTNVSISEAYRVGDKSFDASFDPPFSVDVQNIRGALRSSLQDKVELQRNIKTLQQLGSRNIEAIKSNYEFKDR